MTRAYRRTSDVRGRGTELGQELGLGDLHGMRVSWREPSEKLRPRMFTLSGAAGFGAVLATTHDWGFAVLGGVGGWIAFGVVGGLIEAWREPPLPPVNAVYWYTDGFASVGWGEDPGDAGYAEHLGVVMRWDEIASIEETKTMEYESDIPRRTRYVITGADGTYFNRDITRSWEHDELFERAVRRARLRLPPQSIRVEIVGPLYPGPRPDIDTALGAPTPIDVPPSYPRATAPGNPRHRRPVQ